MQDGGEAMDSHEEGPGSSDGGLLTQKDDQSLETAKKISFYQILQILKLLDQVVN